MAEPTMNSAEYWHHKAAETRARAERMVHPEARAALLDVAEKYEAMAQRTASRE